MQDKKVVCMISVFLMATSLLSANSTGKIVYPWNAVTTIVEAGDSFEVWFDAEPGQVVESVELHGPYNTVNIPSESVTSESGTWEYDPISENTYNMQITVTVPANTPADRYDLVLNTNQGQLTSISAVTVIKEYRTNYKIFHIADSHLAQQGYEVLIEKKHTALVNMANIINPDIVFVAGDNVYYHADKTRNQGRIDRFYLGKESEGWKGMHDFNAATFVVAGNHDYQQAGPDRLPRTGYYDLKSDYWNTYHGLQYHTFKYGNSRFILLNNGWHYYNWGWQRDRASNWLNGEGSGGNLNVAVAHHPRPDQMDSFANDNNLGLLLVGHYHHRGEGNPYKIGDKLIMYYAHSVRDLFEFCLFQVDNSTGKYEALGYTNTDSSRDGYGLSTGSNRVIENYSEKNNPDMSAWVYNLTLDYDHDNDGSVSNNTATLVNKFDYTIPDARVRFVIPKGDAYEVSDGTIYQAFDGDDYHIVDVDIDLPAESTTTVDIYDVGDAIAVGASAHGEKPDND